MRKPHVQCLGAKLSGCLQESAKLKNLPIKDQAVYLVEVMVGIVQSETRFRLQPEPRDPSVARLGIRLNLADWLDDKLFHMAGSYGLNRQQLIRSLLWMALDLEKQINPLGQILRKEDFVGLAVEKLRQPTSIN